MHMLMNFVLFKIKELNTLKNLAQTLNKFYKAKVGKFIKTFDKTLLNPYICLLYNSKQKT